MSHSNRVIASLAVGLAFASLTWLTVGLSPLSIGPKFTFLFGIISILLIPGMFLGLLLSQNVHLVNVWLMAVGNFIIYFGVAYLLLAKREKRRVAAKTKLGGQT